MKEYLPLLVVGAIIGVLTLVFVLAYALIKNKKESIGFDRQMKDGEIMKRIIPYAKPYIPHLVIALVIMLISVAYDIISPLLVKHIVKLISEPGFSMRPIIITVIVYASVLIISLICTYAQALLLTYVGQKMLSAIREDAFTHIESLSHNQLNHQPVGKLVTRVTNDTNSISMFVTSILMTIAKNALVIVATLVAMLMINYALTLMVLCFVPFVVVFTWIFRKFLRLTYRKIKDNTTDINTFLSENLSGMKITQIFNREERKLEEFCERNERLGKSKERQILVFGFFRPAVYMLYISSVLCLLYFGARGVIKETTLFGQSITGDIIVAFYMYVQKFFNPIQTLAEQFNRIQAAMASAEKILTVMDMKPEIVDSPDAIELESVRGEIEFRNVWFAYIEDEWVLRDVSFKVAAGDTVAFVGSTGSGKTTILSLLCRNYDIQRGEILVDGIDVRKIKISSLRRHFGQMLQDVFMFSGTIRSNIVLRDESITDEEVGRVCDYVNASHFINKLPAGLDEQVRERGNNFSQGQRQLMSFARTIAHRPSVMILDEATANIDTETELLIQDSLEKIKSIGTMLVVAHRLSTVQHADKIIVLSKGEIIEEGNHFELLEKRGRYYSLYMLQYNKEKLGAK
ncbi:MAG: ABC transporter ATP-binding protein [Clostridia bacterium]|nr:ABC transporter ATP-binding protein [Clostridia bacterium]